MKLNSTKITGNCDLELLNILKNDIQEQHHKMKSKFIHLATKVYDNELLNIIKSDLTFIKSQFSNSNQILSEAI